MRTNVYILLLFAAAALFKPCPMNAQDTNPESVVQANLDAYNALDLEGFMSYFSEDIQIRNYDSGEVTANGQEAVRTIYDRLFRASPELHSRILKRTVFGNKVIDHEYITGRNGSAEPLELVLIYEVRDGKIFRISVMRH